MNEQFDIIMAKHRERLSQALCRLMKDRAEVKEVALASELAARERFMSFNAHADFFTWLYRIGFNEAVSYRRKKKSEK